MKPKTFMLIAGEASGDTLAAELVSALRAKVLEVESAPTADVQPLRTPLAPRFFGAGGPKMAAEGVELAFDLTEHSVIGLSDVLKKLVKFRRLFHQLFRLAVERQPDVIIGVDYGVFNLRLGLAIRRYVRRRLSSFQPWNPKLVQFVSPQVWASRPGRARVLEENHDLLLSIFPFEKAWYAERAPKLRVEFVGHPMVGRFALASPRSSGSPNPLHEKKNGGAVEHVPTVLLLPGSRPDEVRRHLAVIAGSFELIRKKIPGLRGKMVLPTDSLAREAAPVRLTPNWRIQTGAESARIAAGWEVQVGGLADALATADLAIAKSGTVTLECAFHGVPAVVLYKTSWPTYWIGRRVLSVDYLAMPNLLANEPLFPEFIQHAATPENISGAATELLGDDIRRQAIKTRLAKVVASLGEPGATTRAAEAIISLLP